MAAQPLSDLKGANHGAGLIGNRRETVMRGNEVLAATTAGGRLVLLYWRVKISRRAINVLLRVADNVAFVVYVVMCNRIYWLAHPGAE